MQYIPLIISTAAILVSLYLAFHKEHRDDQSKESKESKDLSVAFAKMDVKQDSILSAVNEMRLDQKAQNQRITDIEKQVALIDASTKSAHHRLDDIVKQFGINSERKSD